MTFLDSTPDLTDSVFTDQHLEYSRNFLIAAIQKHDPVWAEKPTGPLSVFWHQDGVFPTCYLIEFSRVMDTANRAVTAESEPILEAKFKNLLRPSSEKQFEETYTEMQVVSMISERASPIALDPLVPRNQLSSGSRPPTPDLAIRLLEADVLIEVTVLYYGALADWDKAGEMLQEDLSRQIRKAGGSRMIRLDLPLSFKGIRMSAESIGALSKRILSEERGALNLVLGDRYIGRMSWEPFPHIQVDQPEMPVDLPSGIDFATLGPDASQVQNVVGFQRWLSEEDHGELALRSIRNTLKRKRKQFPHEAPYILVIKLGHHRMRNEGFIHTINQRIWPNPEYGWIPALALFSPRTQFKYGAPPPSLNFLLNPHARNKLPESVMQLITGEELFYLKGGEGI
jgi:hypothetical protein